VAVRFEQTDVHLLAQDVHLLLNKNINLEDICLLLDSLNSIPAEGRRALIEEAKVLLMTI